MEHAELDALEQALQATEDDARAVVSGLGDAAGTWQPNPDSWSVADCLEHLAVGDRVYVDAMQPSADQARARGRYRRGRAVPGLVGGWFVRSLEPPVRSMFRMRAPRKIRPQTSGSAQGALERFLAAHHDVVAFLRAHAMLDLAGITFPNPFLHGVRFSLATGLHVLAAHERRHLWQAWRVRRTAEQHLS